MNVVIGTAAGIGGMLLSDQILYLNLPDDCGIFRLLFAPVHPVVGCLYALAATGSTPILSTAGLTVGVLMLFDMDDGPHCYYSADETVPPLRPIKNALRRLAAYLASAGLNLLQPTTAVEQKPVFYEPAVACPDRRQSVPGFVGSLSVGRMADDAADADDDAEYVFC
jgi:hypothetical protein